MASNGNGNGAAANGNGAAAVNGNGAAANGNGAAANGNGAAANGNGAAAANGNAESFVGGVLAGLNLQDLLSRAIKYMIEGLAVAVAAYYIPRRKMDLQEIAMIAVTGALTFAILDMYAPSIASGARRGAGFGIGAAQVGWPRGA